jgi:glycosyltransferase involved in cell wall biosynthesis
VDLTLVVPCYNEAEHLEASVARLIETCDLLRIDYEVIFVDDASTDATPALLERIVARYPGHQMRTLANRTNLGRGAAVSRGLAEALAPIAGFLDIDLEVDATYVAPFFLAIRDGADLAIGRRIYRIRPRLWARFVLTRGYATLRHVLVPQPFDDTEAGFKFFRLARMRPVLDACRDPRWFWDTEIVVRAHDAGLRIVEVPCLFVRRHDKTSTVKPVRDAWRHLRGVLRLRAERSEGKLALPDRAHLP